MEKEQTFLERKRDILIDLLKERYGAAVTINLLHEVDYKDKQNHPEDY